MVGILNLGRVLRWAMLVSGSKAGCPFLHEVDVFQDVADLDCDSKALAHRWASVSVVGSN